MALRGITLIAVALLAGCNATHEHKVQLLNEDGRFLFSKGDFKNARDSFEMAVELQPNDPVLLYNLASCCDRMGETSKAEMFYIQCLLRNRDHTEARFGLGRLYFRQGRKEDFDRLLAEWYELQPREPYPYVLDGWRLRQEKAFPESQVKFQQALALEPHHPKALTELGVWFEQMELPAYAMAMYERSLDRQPDQPEVRERLDVLRSKNVGPPLPLQ